MSDYLLRARAMRILDDAAKREPVSMLEVTAFARECIEQTRVGRLALEVLTGGPLANRRSLELAALVLRGP